MKKKILALCMAVTLCFTMLLAGCSEGNDDNPSGTGGKKEDFKIGVLYIGEIGDMGYTYAHDVGIEYMKKELKLNDKQVIKQINVQEDASCKDEMIAMIEEGCKIIFGTSYGYMDYMDELAKEYPNIIFAHCSGFKANDKNFTNYFGRINQGRYLAGIAAGMKLKEDGKTKLGYVAAKKTPEVISGANAFLLGAQSILPEATMTVKWTDSWYAPDLEKQAAEALISEGCYVIGQHCDTDKPMQAAQAAGVFGCGYNADMTSAAPDAHLTAPVWHWGVYYKDAVQKAMDGKWTPEIYYTGMKEGIVGYSELSKNCAEGTKEKIEEAAAKIISGELSEFAGPIVSRKGTVVCEEGNKLSDSEILSMNYFVKGITGDLDDEK